jgi:hypothetical protein
MTEGEYQLGDWVDDYCTRCKLIMNHYIVSMVGSEIAKVRCQTCQHEQNFRHGKEGKKKESRQVLFAQVVSGLNAAEAGKAAASKSRTRKN